MEDPKFNSEPEDVMEDTDDTENTEDMRDMSEVGSKFECLQQNRFTRNLFPPSGKVATVLTLLVTTVTVFLAARSVLGPLATPGGSIFALLVMILVAMFAGKLLQGFHLLVVSLFKFELHLPPLCGMIVVGILLKNVPYNYLEDCSDHQKNVSAHLDNHACPPRFIGNDLDPQISSTLRAVCLTVILLMAGLELDPVQLRKLKGMVLRATFIPFFVEATATAVLCNLILGFPWMIGFMLGFMLAAIIIPCFMSLTKRGYGVEKGIPTVVIAACSVDDVFAIAGFGIFMGVIFSAGAPLWKLILHGPIEIIMGVSFGIFWGFLCHWIPSKNSRHVAFFRWFILTGGGLIAVFGSSLLGYNGAGGLATIIMGFVASVGWRNDGWDENNPVIKIFHRMWIILEPVIFALIGTQIQVDKISPETLGKCTAVLVLAMLIRMVGTFFAVCGGNLNKKEKLFMTFAWLPKATVQAALGPIFLDKVLQVTEEEWKNLGDKVHWTEMGNDVLTMAVLSILITAPIGAMFIMTLGSRLLSTNIKEEEAGKGEQSAFSSA